MVWSTVAVAVATMQSWAATPAMISSIMMGRSCMAITPGPADVTPICRAQMMIGQTHRWVWLAFQ
jgi:hypothetical protein